jgi:hypothetical protein
MIGVPYHALTGEYGLAWPLLSWGITVPVHLTGLCAWLVLFDRRFGWGLTGSPPGSAPATSVEEVVSRNGDRSAAENWQEALDGSDAEPDTLGTLASWLPHPDDPLPAEVTGMFEAEEEEPAPDLQPVATQPVSTEEQTRPRPRRRRRRLRG